MYDGTVLFDLNDSSGTEADGLEYYSKMFTPCLHHTAKMSAPSAKEGRVIRSTPMSSKSTR